MSHGATPADAQEAIRSSRRAALKELAAATILQNTPLTIWTCTPSCPPTPQRVPHDRDRAVHRTSRPRPRRWLHAVGARRRALLHFCVLGTNPTVRAQLLHPCGAALPVVVPDRHQQRRRGLQRCAGRRPWRALDPTRAALHERDRPGPLSRARASPPSGASAAGRAQALRPEHRLRQAIWTTPADLPVGAERGTGPGLVVPSAALREAHHEPSLRDR